MLDYAAYLCDHGWLSDPVYVILLPGSLGTVDATPLNLALLVERLVRVARAMGRESATPDQVRERPGIARPNGIDSERAADAAR